MSNVPRYYYEVVLLRSSAPTFTYTFLEALTLGTVVNVPLKTTIKSAVITAIVNKPSFDTAEISSVFDYFYSP